MINIVLLEPEKPDNTGNIGRTCVCTSSRLHLIRPLGFQLDEKHLKKAGMDYWNKLDLYVYDDLNDFYEKNPYARDNMYFSTTKSPNTYSNISYKDGDYIMFGPESRGIPESIMVHKKEKCIRIPMKKEERSLNLSNSVAIVLYEALRQNNFLSLETKGKLHNLEWE